METFDRARDCRACRRASWRRSRRCCRKCSRQCNDVLQSISVAHRFSLIFIALLRIVATVDRFRQQSAEQGERRRDVDRRRRGAAARDAAARKSRRPRRTQVSLVLCRSPDDDVDRFDLRSLSILEQKEMRAAAAEARRDAAARTTEAAATVDGVGTPQHSSSTATPAPTRILIGAARVNAVLHSISARALANDSTQSPVADRRRCRQRHSQAADRAATQQHDRRRCGGAGARSLVGDDDDAVDGGQRGRDRRARRIDASTVASTRFVLVLSPCNLFVFRLELLNEIRQSLRRLLAARTDDLEAKAFLAASAVSACSFFFFSSIV